MELAIFFYFAGIVEQIHFGLSTIGGILLFALIVALAICCAEGVISKYKKNFQLLFIIPTTCLILAGLTPDKQTLYTMAAAYGVQSAAENNNVQRIAGKSLQLLEKKMDEYLKEE